MSLSQQPPVYAVGQVSGSLFQQSSEPSGSLSALFGTTLPASTPLFQPVPKVKTHFWLVVFFHMTQRAKEQPNRLTITGGVLQR